MPIKLDTTTVLYCTYSTLLYSTLLYSTLLYSTLLYSTLLYSTLLYSTLLYSTLLYSLLLYSTLLDSTRLDSTRLNSTLLDSTRFDSTRLDSTLLYCLLLYSTLKEKALQALFTAKRLMNFLFLKSRHAEKIFDTLIRPIVLYISEVWGAYSNGDFSSWDKTAAEKLHLRFCKLYLGVNSKSSNDACRAELGRLPMKLIVDKQIMKYYQHLNELKHDAIAKQALDISKSLRAQIKNVLCRTTKD